MDHQKLFKQCLFELNNFSEVKVREGLSGRSIIVTGNSRTDKCLLAYAVSQDKLKELSVPKNCNGESK